MRVEDAYSLDVVAIESAEPLVNAARLMHEADVGAVAVDGEATIGILSERDIVRAVVDGADLAAVPVRAYASFLVKTAAIDDDIDAVAAEMLDNGIRHLPVVKDGAVLGMVSIRDVLAAETPA